MGFKMKADTNQKETLLKMEAAFAGFDLLWKT